MEIKSFYRKYPIRISIFLLTLILTGWFITVKFFPRENEHLNGLPERDIIFQVTSGWGGGDIPKYTLGFVNADGSGLVYFTIPRKERWVTTNILRPIKTPIYPIITSDQSTIVFRLLPYSGHAGELVVYHVGEEANICNLSFGSTPPTFSHDESKVVITCNPGLPLGLFDLPACKGGMDISDMVVVDMFPDDSYIHQGSLSLDGSLFAYPAMKKGEDEWVIYVQNLETNKIVAFGIGFFPIWSPDGEQLAYTGKDGIYVVNKDGRNERKLISYINPDTGGRDAMNGEWPPLPSWSPDGRWLVYHKCTVPVAKKSNCYGIEDYSIFKVNIETGEEYKILDGGLNPYWRK